MSWFKKKDRNKLNDLRIVEITNGLGEVSYNVERCVVSSSFDIFPSRTWTMELVGFSDYDTALEEKEKLDIKINKNKVVSKRVIT